MAIQYMPRVCRPLQKGNDDFTDVFALFTVKLICLAGMDHKAYSSIALQLTTSLLNSCQLYSVFKVLAKWPYTSSW